MKVEKEFVENRTDLVHTVSGTLTCYLLALGLEILCVKMDTWLGTKTYFFKKNAAEPLIEQHNAGILIISSKELEIGYIKLLEILNGFMLEMFN